MAKKGDIVHFYKGTGIGTGKIYESPERTASGWKYTVVLENQDEFGAYTNEVYESDLWAVQPHFATCSVCRRVFRSHIRRAMFLKCGHLFCWKCLFSRIGDRCPLDGKLFADDEEKRIYSEQDHVVCWKCRKNIDGHMEVYRVPKYPYSDEESYCCSFCAFTYDVHKPDKRLFVNFVASDDLDSE